GGGERIGLQIERRQANAVDGDRIAVIRAFGDNTRADHDARILTTHLDTAHCAKLFNYSGEHKSSFVRMLRQSIDLTSRPRSHRRRLSRASPHATNHERRARSCRTAFLPASCWISPQRLL